MTAQQKRERPEATGESHKNQPEIPGRGKPGTMPENPASIDHQHEPAGIDPHTDRTKEHAEKRGKS